MPYTYMNPPVVEAACEFRFDASSSWDLAIPGQVYTDLREQFPDKEQAQTIEATLGVGNEGFQQAISRQELLKMESHDKTEVVQVAAHRLVVSKLRPYSSWGEFRPLIMRAFRSYLGVAQPAGLYRMGLRYINRLNLPQEPAQLEDYLEYYPFTGPELPSMMDSFLVGATFPFGERDSLKVQLASGVAGQGELSSVLLDLDYSLQVPGAVAIDGVEHWLEDAHAAVERAFEACVKPTLRETFGQRQESST